MPHSPYCQRKFLTTGRQWTLKPSETPITGWKFKFAATSDNMMVEPHRVVSSILSLCDILLSVSFARHLLWACQKTNTSCGDSAYARCNEGGLRRTYGSSMLQVLHHLNSRSFACTEFLSHTPPSMHRQLHDYSQRDPRASSEVLVPSRQSFKA